MIVVKPILAAGITFCVTGLGALWYVSRQTGAEHWQTMGEDDGESAGISAKSHGFGYMPRPDVWLASRKSADPDDANPTAAQEKIYTAAFMAKYDSSFKG